MGSISTCLSQEATLYGVKKDLSVTRSHFIWDQQGLVCYKNAPYMVSISTCLSQKATLYGVNKHLSVTRSHFI